MERPHARRLGARLASGVALALVAALALTLPAAAWSKDWTKPKLVFKYAPPPTHDTAVDSAGKTHIATERGSGGIWYVTNVSGSWTKCQISSGNDREPSIATAGGVVHIAFARRSGDTRGLYTASSDQETGGEGCGWTPTRRQDGPVSHPSMEAFGSTLSIAFRTGGGKLRFTRGASGDPSWTMLETIDGKCCTSMPSLALTTTGAPRVAYGDGTKKAEGLKYAVRTGSGWKKSKAAKGRVKQVTMVLDKSPGVFTPPSNAPRIAFVINKKGTYYAAKGSSGARGRWFVDFYGRGFARPGIRVWSNDELILVGRGGKYWYSVKRAAIRFGYTLTTSGRDIKMILAGQPGGIDVVTFARKKGTKGIYFSRRK